ncbi:molybdenum cofactor guanylyltransferase MobA [Gellertiella hungarica]|uniref:Molybdenum cofactor guanylyltransferase n=1 Tax=Gellertiella hungarica TaxID=1572859 RepID=A0A7W6J5U8_9HYPH|nr:molybdenum cofactor guanylyltransferase MobA [Gellertiella hungarica]MBB4064562.1 molybdopterin-guanine dinucleotide biosynthesis protein A [Gellertiella hungarica]
MSAPLGIVLAGGLSRRMGQDKTALPFGDDTLLGHALARLGAQCARVAVNAGSRAGLPSGVDVIPDDIAGYAGPLAGVAAGLAQARRLGFSRVVTIAADTPFFPETLVAALCAAATEPDAIAVAEIGGEWHPAFALWPVALEDDLRHWLSDPGNRRLKAFIRRHPHRAVSFPLIPTGEGAIDPFFNINTPDDYRRALALREIMA